MAALPVTYTIYRQPGWLYAPEFPAYTPYKPAYFDDTDLEEGDVLGVEIGVDGKPKIVGLDTASITPPLDAVLKAKNLLTSRKAQGWIELATATISSVIQRAGLWLSRADGSRVFGAELLDNDTV